MLVGLLRGRHAHRGQPWPDGSVIDSPRSAAGASSADRVGVLRREILHAAARTASARRTRGIRLAAVALAAGSLAVAVPGLASAHTVAGPTTLLPGASVCVSQQADYRVRGDGTATRSGAVFTLYRNRGFEWSTGFPVSATAVEMRSDYGTFPGAGMYEFCAYNSGSTKTRVTVSILTDGDTFPD